MARILRVLLMLPILIATTNSEVLMALGYGSETKHPSQPGRTG